MVIPDLKEVYLKIINIEQASSLVDFCPVWRDSGVSPVEWVQQGRDTIMPREKIEEPGSLRSLEAERENLKMIHKADQGRMITCFGH
jgi:hypothetical protein